MADDSPQCRPARLAALIATATLLVPTLASPVATATERHPPVVLVATDDGSATSTAEGDATDAPQADVKSASSDREVPDGSVASLEVERAAARSQLVEAKAARDHQFDRWALTHLAAEAAKEKARRTSMAATEAQQQVVVAQERVREYAVEAFMRPPALDSMAVLAVGGPEQASRAHDLVSITADDKGRVVGELSSAKDAAERAATVAQEVAESAARREADGKAELDALEESVRTQERLAAQIDQRLDNALAEVASLREVDSDAAEQMEAEEVALADDSRAALGGRGTDGTTDSQGPAVSGPGVSSSGKGAAASPKSNQSPKPPDPPPPPPPPPGTVTWNDVTKVGTFWVHNSIAANVQGLISAARSAGFSLTGGGFRDPESQISLRQAHCGTSYYDVYEKPASQCTPPTAIPGRSMHEKGRALDIKSGGALITSRSDPAFQWLAANASSYGFYNLPSEPWHWSTNGT